MGQTLDCLCKGIESTQSHWPEEAIPDSYDKCEPVGNMEIIVRSSNFKRYLFGNLFIWTEFKLESNATFQQVVKLSNRISNGNQLYAIL